jgi:hypothetical protein
LLLGAGLAGWALTKARRQERSPIRGYNRRRRPRMTDHDYRLLRHGSGSPGEIS